MFAVGVAVDDVVVAVGVAVVVCVVVAVVVVVADILYPYTNQYHRHKQNNKYHKDFVQIVEHYRFVLIMNVVVVDFDLIDVVVFVVKVFVVVDVVYKIQHLDFDYCYYCCCKTYYNNYDDFD